MRDTSNYNNKNIPLSHGQGVVYENNVPTLISSATWWMGCSHQPTWWHDGFYSHRPKHLRQDVNWCLVVKIEIKKSITILNAKSLCWRTYFLSGQFNNPLYVDFIKFPLFGLLSLEFRAKKSNMLLVNHEKLKQGFVQDNINIYYWNFISKNKYMWAWKFLTLLHGVAWNVNR